MTQNNANNVYDNKNDTRKSITHTLTSDQYQRLMSLLSGTGDTSKAHASVAENESCQNNLRPDEPNDDKKSSIDSNIKSIPETSTHKPSVVTINDAVSVDEHLHNAETVDTTDTADVDSNLPVETSDTADTANADNASDTSSRKDTVNSEYATETTVSDGIQSTSNVDDEYNSEGEELDMFGKMFETPEPAGAQTVRRTSRMTALPSKYKDYVLNKNLNFCKCLGLLNVFQDNSGEQVTDDGGVSGS
ncbi:hypothetical protein CTI12_AA187380 [Artemisia annua]|uniref:Uncharacterized protein n=1 Tax=Artemisia annua TaxID=35608 RepID=A0A2U1P6R4_ARTAN|nr:hypothetical protein CTI12_AA187380 [Artemisia annua]